MPARDYYLPSRRLVSQDDAALIESARVPRSRFKGSRTRKTTFDAGYLVPFLVDEILPGDHMKYNVTAYVRLSTPLFPILDNQRIDTFFFFCPNRLVWANWVRMMGEQDSPGDSIAFTVPQIVPTGSWGVAGTIFDHMGIVPISSTTLYSFNALPFRMYNLIFNTWFRDQNIVPEAWQAWADGPDAHTNYELRYRAKAHDYFTSALPWAQKFTSPTLPMGGLAPIIGLGTLDSAPILGAQVGVRETGGGTRTYDFAYSSSAEVIAMRATAAADAYPSVYADLSLATGVPINTFRMAFMTQQLLERDARGGTRYVELIRSHFNVTNPDFRLQRPEYIGGGQTSLQITPVAQTAPSAGVTVGALGAAGTAAGSHSASYAATEHGFIIGLINVRTELSYQKGLHRMWSRLTRLDYYWPSFAGLGEQAILRKEIYAVGDGGTLDDVVFGYQERWHEYRTMTSEVTGMFRSQFAGTLDAWHLAQNFTGPPVLDETFIVDNPPMARILAAGGAATGQQYLADLYIERTAVRPIPTFGTPATLGRF